MSEQSSIVFNLNISNKEEFEAYLVFEFTDDDGKSVEVEVPFSGGEELESHMKSYLNEKWSDLLPEYMKDVTFMDCSLEGIHMKGKQKKGRFATYLTNNYKRNTIIINENALLNESAEKLLKIRDIILQ
jgi:hypothetical protein